MTVKQAKKLIKGDLVIWSQTGLRGTITAQHVYGVDIRWNRTRKSIFHQWSDAPHLSAPPNP